MKTGDNWWNVGKKYGFQDPWDVIGFNYGTRDPEEVNWYLRELVGCTKSTDGLNYSFDSSDRFGVIFIPPRGYKYTRAEPRGAEWILADAVSALRTGRAPYLQYGALERMVTGNVFCVGDPNLPVAAEYDYRNILFFRTSGAMGRRGTIDQTWITKEVCHVAYGEHGLKMRFSARTEAVALLGAYAYKKSRPETRKLPFAPLQISSYPARAAIQNAMEEFLAAGVGNLDAVEREVAKEPRLLRRLNGTWRPKG